MKNKRLQWVINGLESRGIDFQTATEYGEPGYSTDKPVILFADWNPLSMRTLNAIEAVAEIEWSDEWVQDNSGRAFRSSPDCYGWEPSFFISEDCEIVPFDTLPAGGEDLAGALRDYGFTASPGDTCGLEALPSGIGRGAMETFATMIVGDCETGFHPGQNDKPEAILAGLPDGEYVFRINGKGQFDISWEVWKLNPVE